MNFTQLINLLGSYVWSWPLLLLIVLASLFFTIILRFVQFRYFFYSWKLLFFPPKSGKRESADLTPFQAFLNSLGASVGNGSIAGVSTAVASGGPGAAFWMVVIGFMLLSIRFAEVFLGSFFSGKGVGGKAIGGPILYLKEVPGRKYLPYIYALLCLFYGLIVGNAMQCNSIGVSIVRTWGVNPVFIAFVISLFIFYIVIGGAKRIVSVSDKIVPFKVALFLFPALIVLLVNYRSLLPSLKLIVQSAFNPAAFAGGIVGITVQSVIRYGVARSLNANEIGLGTASLLFGSTGGDEPVKNGIMSMLSAFISTHIICVLVALSLISTGVWNNGQTSAALLISAFETVFGSWGGWIVTISAISFGIGVLVTYSYIVKECWMYLSNGRFAYFYIAAYTLAAFLGTVGSVEAVWGFTDIVNGFMLFINLFGVIYLLPIVKKHLLQFMGK